MSLYTIHFDKTLKKFDPQFPVFLQNNNGIDRQQFNETLDEWNEVMTENLQRLEAFEKRCYRYAISITAAIIFMLFLCSIFLDFLISKYFNLITVIPVFIYLITCSLLVLIIVMRKSRITHQSIQRELVNLLEEQNQNIYHPKQLMLVLKNYDELRADISTIVININSTMELS